MKKENIIVDVGKEKYIKVTRIITSNESNENLHKSFKKIGGILLETKNLRHSGGGFWDSPIWGAEVVYLVPIKNIGLVNKIR